MTLILLQINYLMKSNRQVSDKDKRVMLFNYKKIKKSPKLTMLDKEPALLTKI